MELSSFLIMVVVSVLILYVCAEAGSWHETKRARKKEGLKLPGKRRYLWVVHGFYCFNCKTELNLRDMIPIISYILYRGKCRYCGNPIGIRNLISEIIGLVVGILLIWAYWSVTIWTMS